MKNWYAFQSKTRKERFLCEQLRLRHIETFFPVISIQPVNSRNLKFKPYFPGYVFAYVDPDASPRSILDWLPGAVRIVSFGGMPASVPDQFIKLLRQHLEIINSSSTGKSKRLLPDDQVSIREGPFAGYSGIFNTRLPGCNRVEVLLNMLQGSQIRVDLTAVQIIRQNAEDVSIG